ncbi:YtfJ family protein, partial [Pseudomonas aeruginosa]
MKTSRMLMVSLLLAPLFASAHNLQLKQRVAPVGVSNKGEINYAEGNFSYQNWNSAQLSGKVRVIQN